MFHYLVLIKISNLQFYRNWILSCLSVINDPTYAFDQQGVQSLYTLVSIFMSLFQEPSLFAVAKLLETGLVNMDRIEILWRPLTGHLLEVTSI